MKNIFKDVAEKKKTAQQREEEAQRLREERLRELEAANTKKTPFCIR